MSSLPAVLPGDKIGLIAPAGFVEEKDIQQGIHWLTARGYRVVPALHLYGKDRYFSGTIHQRVADIHRFLRDDSIKILYAVRGGVGSSQLLPELDFDLWQATRKFLVGFSDVTALQWALWKKTGLPSLSGMTLTSQLNERNPYADMFFELLSGKRTEWTAADFESGLIQVGRPGNAWGMLLGGTLSIINSLLGTPYFPLPDKLILYLEDVNEPFYRIERSLVQLKQSGVLERVSGVIFGQFRADRQQIDPWPVISYLFPPDIPVIVNFPYGHIPDCCPLPLGVNARLTTEPFHLRWD